MTDNTMSASAGWRMKVALGTLVLSLLTVAWFLIAALGTKFGLWSWQFGLGTMTFNWGPKLAMLAVGVSLIAQVIALIQAPRKQPFIIALAATLIAAMLMFRLMGMSAQAAALPPLHDIQTDWDNPVSFSETLMAARTEDGALNSVEPAPKINLPSEGSKARWPEMHDRLVSVVQEEAEGNAEGARAVYPALAPVYFSGAPIEVANQVENLIRKKGWTLVTPAPASIDDGEVFQIEATATSGWFGFKDDVAIRVQPVEGALKVDMRSVSRVGLSDLGANSKRVAGFMNELRDRGDGRLAP